MDHRLALGLLTALLILAGAPLAYAWARLLPEEPEPFQAQSDGEEHQAPASNKKGRRGKNPFAIILLLVITIGYLLKFPGIPVGRGLALLGRVVPQSESPWLVLGARWFFVVVPGLVAAYSVMRAHRLRVPLIMGGVLVTGLWLAGPYLAAAIQR